jgi:hemolysin activation/secretion protein
MPNKTALFSLNALVIGFMLSSTGTAAQPFSVPQKRPSEEPLETPPLEEQPASPPLQLPDIRLPPPPAGLPAVSAVYVKQIKLTGNTVFSDQELSALTGAYQGRRITANELQRLRYELTLYYVNNGYINSGAIIPDQTVEDGVVTIRIIEGRLNEIDVSGNRRLRDSYIRDRAGLGAGPPLNIKRLGSALQILQQNPRIEQINGRLEPGAEKGDSILRVDVREARAYELWLDANNYQPPSVGGYQGSVRGIHRNLTGFGDTLLLVYSGADGLTEWDVDYTLPISARDTELRLGYTYIDSKVVEDPFDVLDIENTEQTFSLGLSHPLVKTVNRTFSLALLLDKRESKSHLLGEPFDFTPAAENGETDITVLRLSQEWSLRQRSQVLAARSLISKGVDWLDATVNERPRDGRFSAWLGQLQWVRRIGARGNRLLVRADAQWTPHALPSMEQFTVGGRYSVRGYRENRLVTDKGLVGSVELRIPLWRGGNGVEINLAPFVDYGWAGNNNSAQTNPDHIGSVGAGLRGALTKRLLYEVYYGYAFQDFDDANEDIQDDGLSFNLSWRLL